ncbi:MAG: alcohol dehydrogenase catalytic domain-containing protein [Fibrobacteria bacterium]|nr:alcohol dehydrogenase catalytic domain-containing protein [Fibrobacteria bacterium]
MSKDKMKAVVINAPGDYGIQMVDVPDVPDGGLLLQVLACGLCGCDLRTLRSGHHRVTLPFIVGHEVAGKVVATGKDYTGKWQEGEVIAVGPLVFCGKCDFCLEGKFELCENYQEIGQHFQGGFAEYLAIPKGAVERGTILTVPSTLEPWAAAVAEPIASCVHAQEKGRITKGETVLIIGAGPIGCVHTAMAKAAGAKKVIIADVNRIRLDLAVPFGADTCIDTSQVNLVEEMKKETEGKGADVVITANPVPETQVQAVEIARKGGRILLFGGVPPEKERPGINTNLIHYNALEVMGTTIFNARHYKKAMDLLASGAIPLNNFITHRFSLDDFVEGAKIALNGESIKMVIEPKW